MYILDCEGVAALGAHLQELGYGLIGPKLEHGVINFGPLKSMDDLARGVRDTQSPGSYRTSLTDEPEWFGYTPGPASLKQYFFTPKCLLCRARGNANGFEMTKIEEEVPKRAFIGVRACDLAALRVQDKVFLEGPYEDPGYRARREKAFIVAVNCSHPASTCFCASMHTGPQAREDFDLALTEIVGPEGHRFLVDTGSEAGGELLAQLPVRMASSKDKEAAILVTERATQQMTREVNPERAARVVRMSLESPHWESLESRCMNCANCTMVCPTCFCSTVEDTTSLSGDIAERWRLWDSCFTSDFSYIHGGTVRKSVHSRYRQWLGHKFAHWPEQFGTSGCVGCGRCITWCPVGIDITEELAALGADCGRLDTEKVS